MYDAYHAKAEFLTVYIAEAHPLDEWQMDSNETQGVCYAQPKSDADRLAIARDFVQREHYGLPLLVDRMDNRADELYAAWPERLYVIGEDGRIAYKGGMGPFAYDPGEVAQWLAKKFGDLEPKANPAVDANSTGG